VRGALQAAVTVGVALLVRHFARNPLKLDEPELLAAAEPGDTEGAIRPSEGRPVHEWAGQDRHRTLGQRAGLRKLRK
jgi:hypothetical protein